MKGKVDRLRAFIAANTKGVIQAAQVLAPSPETRHLPPEPGTFNPNPGTFNPKPGTFNPNPDTFNPKPRHLQPETRNLKRGLLLSRPGRFGIAFQVWGPGLWVQGSGFRF